MRLSSSTTTLTNVRVTCHLTKVLNSNFYVVVTHYYHFAAELLFGFWRTYSSLDTRITEDGVTSLPSPRRLLFTRVENYRDYASMNQYLMSGIFPSLSVEHMRDWKDRNETTQPFVFDRVVLADRSAAMRGEEFVATERTASEAFSLVSSRPWWSPVRANLVEFVGLNRSVGAGTRDRPVITYVSRQEWGRRMLIPADHDKLVEALHDLEKEYGYEVNIVSMDKLSREEQISLATRTTVSFLPLVAYDKSLKDRPTLDNVRRARKRVDCAAMDEPDSTIYRH
jgi:hypothetical protein